VIELGGGRAFVIEAPDTSEANKYVASATLNGRRLGRAYLTHSEISAGGRLVLRMSDKASSWGRERRPPSLPPLP
jgi:putative alpha-1,2-mannosidase